MNPIDNNPVMLPDGVANITIPVDQLAAVQTAIIQTSVQGMIMFFLIGVAVGAVIAVLYMTLLKNAAASGTRNRKRMMNNGLRKSTTADGLQMADRAKD